ncbi:MAG: phage regulatory CII family protein [Syntrophobacteraceae bacterium]
MKNGCWSQEDSEAGRQVKRLIEDLLFQERLPVNQAAARLNISAERLYKYLNQATSNNIPAYLVPIWTRVIGPAFIMHLAKESGGAFVPLVAGQVDELEAIRSASAAMKECSEALNEFSKAYTDGNVTLAELKKIRREVMEAVSALLVLESVAEKDWQNGNGRPRGSR